MQPRLDWIDIAKGVGIVLVVVGHAGRGLSAGGLRDATDVLPVLDATIYAFHMPLFFLLAGVTFGLRPPVSVVPALSSRIWRLLGALVIWTYAFLAMRALAGGAANAGGGWGDVLTWPLPPFAHFWFLWALVLNMAVFALVRIALRPALPDRLFWGVALAVALVGHAAVPVPEPLVPWVSEAVRYTLPFAAGGLIGASALVRAAPGPAAAAAAGAGFAVLLWASVAGAVALPGLVGGTLLALLLLVPLMAVSARWGQAGWARALALLGVASLAIYVMHTMFSAFLRIVLLKAGIDALPLHLALGTAIGLAGPLVVLAVARRFGMARAMGLA